MKILIADDSLFMRMVLRRILTGANYEIVGEAKNGQEAILLSEKLKPDLVILDITMPVINGIEAVKQICSQDPRAKVLMCSAMGQQSMIGECLEHGAKGFIIKPFLKEALLNEIRKITAPS